MYQITKQRYNELTRQQQADVDLLTSFLTKIKQGEMLTSDEKIVTGIIARRLPEGPRKVEGLALYNYLMSQE
jgi:hypothetical protein